MSGNKAVKSEVVSSKKVFDGKIIDVFHDEITLPDGKTALREVVKRGNAAAIVPVDKDGNIIFVKQYRHPAGDVVLEIPAGVTEPEEDPLICAKRELEEETSFKTDDITFIAKMYSAIGFCSEQIYIYLAKNLEKGHFNLDEDEFIEVEAYSLDDAVKMIFDGRIIDSKTMVGILAYKEMLRSENKL